MNNAKLCAFTATMTDLVIAGILGPVLVGVYTASAVFQLSVRSALAAVTSSSGSSSADITAAAAAAVAALDEHTEHASTGSVLAGVGNAAVLCVATFVMMRFFRLVIHERDLYLARAIQVRQHLIVQPLHCQLHTCIKSVVRRFNGVAACVLGVNITHM
jgi:hypothetical protein